MSKTKRSVPEIVFVIVAVAILFFMAFHQMSMDGILPGNDPAVHLAKVEKILQDHRVTYSKAGWYPPLFHVFLAILFLFAGTVDALVVSLMVKLVVASTSSLILLSAYLLARKWLGRGVAIPSALFIMMSAPVFEMICWGGYPNFLGLVFINLIFYIMTKNWENPGKTGLLFLLTFSLILTHQLAAFVFCLLFVPAMLITAKREKRQILTLFAVVLASGLAILAWYAKKIFRYSSVLISHLFFEMKQYTQVIPVVSFDGFTKTFGISIFLAGVGVPLILLLARERGKNRKAILILLWMAVPFFLSQSYLFGIYLPYERFVYFLVTPVAILSGATVYILTRLPAFIKCKIYGKKSKEGKTSILTKAAALIIVVTIFSFQGFLSFQRAQDFPRYYEVSGKTGYDTGQWLKHHSPLNSTVVVSEKPGAWLHVVSDLDTIQEVNPLFERNMVAETVLHLFYEMENSHVLTREYGMKEVSGQALYTSIYNLWEKVATIPDDSVYVTYQEAGGERISIPISESTKKTYWGKRSPHKSQLVCEYSHPLFTLEKRITLYSKNLKVRLRWKLRTHRNLTGVKLRVFTYTASSLNFTEAFVPGVLKWQNPWEEPTYLKPNSWAVVECPPNRLEGNITALFDAENNILMVFRYDEVPDWLNVGALSNRGLDAVRAGYELGDMKRNEVQEASFSIFSYSPEHTKKRWNTTSLEQFSEAKRVQTVEKRDFPTYIEDYDIQFVTVHHTQFLSKSDPPPILDRVYDTGEIITYKAES